MHCRNLSKKLERLLTVFPAVALIGARQCGKTVLAQSGRKHWKYLDLENPRDSAAIAHDPGLYFEQFPSEVIYTQNGWKRPLKT